MSTTPPRYWPTLTGKIHPEAELAVTMAYNALQQHEQALTALNTKIVALQTAATTATTTTATVTPAATTTTLGQVNNQTGTSYIVQDSDYGGLITFANAAAVAVTLNAAVAQFWFAALENLGPGLVTITPQSGTLNGVADLTLPTNTGCWIFFDGVNWWAETAPFAPHSMPKVAHEWLDSYDDATGLFTQSQPAFADVSGVAAVAQLPLATTSAPGAVEPDGSTIIISGSGVISAVGAISTTHSESLTDGFSNFIFAIGDIVTVVGVPN